MLYKELKTLLKENINKELRFEYAPNQYVNPNFHITEVKRLNVNAVDCGGRTDNWNETVLQLWNPASESERYPMKGEKALKILSVVEEKVDLDPNSVVYFEYGNEELHVSNYATEKTRSDNIHLTFVFEGLTTQCKPRNEAVSMSGVAASCCGPALVDAKEAANTVSCC